MIKSSYKFLFIVRRYNPEVSASGSVLSNLANELSVNHSVTIMTGTDFESRDENINKIRIIRIKNNKVLSSPLQRIIKVCNPYAYNKSSVKLLNNSINSLLEKETFDFVIPVTYEEIIACIKVKNKRKEVRLIPLLLEEFLNYRPLGKYDLFFKIREYHNTLLFDDLLNICEKVITLPSVYNIIIEKRKNYKKVVKIEHPMVVDNISKVINDRTLIVYTGGLNLTNRNPQVAIEILLNSNEIKADIIFYAYGNCHTMLNEYAKINSSFKYNGVVSPDIAKEVLSLASIAITIGNRNGTLTPSKVFDAISTGNPILHFYYNENDPYFEYLKNYPYVLFIPLLEDKIESNCKKVSDFVNKHSKSKATFQEIAEHYSECTPKYVTERILNFIEEKI